MSHEKSVEVMKFAAGAPTPGKEKDNDPIPNFSEKAAYQLTALILALLVGVPWAAESVGKINTWLKLSDDRQAYNEAYQARVNAYEKYAEAFGADADEVQPKAENLGSVDSIQQAIAAENGRQVFLERMRKQKQQQVNSLIEQWVNLNQELKNAKSEAWERSYRQQIELLENRMPKSAIEIGRARLTKTKDNNLR